MKIDSLKKEIVLDTITWSFSSVNLYQTCPKCFYLQYIEKVEKNENAFAQWGTLMHSILERYLRGEIELYELPMIYEREYQKTVTTPFPYNLYVDLNEKYYDNGIDYLSGLQGLSDEYEIIDAEKQVKTDINGLQFVGYVDLILKNQKTGEYIIVDHKSKNKFANKREESEYARQLYLYNVAIGKQFGICANKLVFNMFQANGLVVIPRNQESEQDAVHWFTGTIRSIQNDKKFTDKIVSDYKSKKKKIGEFEQSDYFCNNICSCRNHCQRSRCYER